jgi:hypothetical protein
VVDVHSFGIFWYLGVMKGIMRAVVQNIKGEGARDDHICIQAYGMGNWK